VKRLAGSNLLGIDTRTSPVSHVQAISKHEFACIPIAAVHYNTVSVYEYELP